MSTTIKKLAGGAGRLLLAYVLVLSQVAWAGQDPKAKDNPKPEQKAATQSTGKEPSSAVAAPEPRTPNVEGEESEKENTQEKSSGDGKHEGIKVHGHWTIEVRDPDGTMVRRTEFENSYTGLLLQLLLSRQGTVGPWGIIIGVTTQPGSIEFVYITEPVWQIGGSIPPNNNNLTIAAPTLSGPSSQSQSVIFSGSVAVPFAGSITSVQTQQELSCTPSVSPQSCGSTSPTSAAANQQSVLILQNPFTTAQLASPVAVSAGQTVAVTVVISFS